MRTLSMSVGFVCIFSALCWCQSNSDWQVEVRRYAEASNWRAAIALVNAQISQRPNDAEALAWHARLLLWSGQLDQAETEWKRVVAIAPRDPDNWIGLASAYSRRGTPRQAIEAIDKALALDPARADIHLARARILLALQDPTQAKIEFRKAADLDPANADARAGMESLRAPVKHQVLLGTQTDLLSYAGHYQENEITVLSQWSPHWKTNFAGGFYERAGVNAAKFGAGITGVSSAFGALTVGATAAHDSGIIPRNEALFAYDRGWRLSGSPILRGLELVYGQHWYWYSTARILTATGTTIVYLPKDWTWSLALTGAHSQFGGDLSQWRPSGTSKLGFPIIPKEGHHLEGNIFFACGTEDFSQVDQIGSFSSRTYGGGLRLQLTKLQDVTGFAAYQMRSQNQSQTSFGVNYGLRF